MADTLQRLLIKLEANTEQLQREMRKASGSTSKFTKTTKRQLGGLQKSFNRLGNAAVAFGAIYAAALVTRGIKNTILLADNMGMLEDRIKSATRETGGFKDVWEDLLATSLKTGTSLDASVSLFQRLAFTQKELGATNKDMTKLNDIIAKLGVISGSTTEQLKNGTLQLSQGLGEGIFRAQEFNSVLESMPAVLNAIGRSMGITVSELRRLVVSGKLLSKDVFAAILDQGDVVEKQFKEIPPRVGRAWSKVMTALAERISEVNKELKVTAFLAGLLEDVASGLEIAPEIITNQEKLNQLFEERGRIARDFNRLTKITQNITAGSTALEVVTRQLNELDESITKLQTKQFQLKFGRFDPTRPGIDEGKKPGRKIVIPFKPIPISDIPLPKFDTDVELLREIRDNATETSQILEELAIDVLRISGKVTEAIRTEADAEIAIFKERVALGKSTTEDLAQFRILKNQEVAAKLKEIADRDLERLNKSATDFGNAMAAAFESRGIDAILNGDLSGALKGIIRDFAAMAIRLAILKPLAEALFKGSDGGSIFGDIFKSILGAGKAGGGNISGPTLVGERGPELFIPKTAGTIRTAADTRGMMGRGPTSITQNITVATDVKNTVRAEMFQLFPILEQQLLNSINQQFAGVKA